ncbi:MAG TPA: hypothetical protein VM536_16970, partial [Chloroflexia bacterium]|nr:hypothetical protein [Chloroflexia bacterium]
TGDIPRDLDATRAALDLAEKTGDLLQTYIGCAQRAWAYSRLGEHATAEEFMAQSRATGKQLGSRLILANFFAAQEAELALNAGRPAEAIARAAAAIAAGQALGELPVDGLAHRVWGEALAAGPTPDRAAADEHLAASVQAYLAGAALLEGAHSERAWGRVCRAHGDADGAAVHLGRAAAQYREYGLAQELERLALEGVPV